MKQDDVNIYRVSAGAALEPGINVNRGGYRRSERGFGLGDRVLKRSVFARTHMTFSPLFMKLELRSPKGGGRDPGDPQEHTLSPASAPDYRKTSNLSRTLI